MAKSSGNGLNLVARLSVEEAIKNAQKLKKELKGLGVDLPNAGKGFDVKPLTTYQEGLLKIKREQLELAKQKADDAVKYREQADEERRLKNEAAAANRAASLATQAALKEEARIKKEQIALEKQLAAEQAKIRKVPGTISSPLDANSTFQNSTVRSESVIIAERVARAQLNTELAKQAVLNRDLSLTTTTYFKAATEVDNSTKKVVLSKKELARLLAEEKYIQAEATKELKNRVREDLNAKGSTEARRAALIRLQTTYDRLSATERSSPAGQRLQGLVSRLHTQVLGLENATGRAGRNVGNYGTKMINTFSSIASSLGITFGVAAIVQFGKELFGIAQKAEGVELAFAKIGDRRDLEKLRASVKDTVSDMELISLAVRADKFKIPLDVLAKGLEFSRQRAIDLGKDVDYMVNSFVDGVGRKSALVLDNLGISASELQQEVRKTGDFAQAVGNIMQREMAKGGIAVDNLAEKSGRLSTIWENLKKTVANFFNSTKLDTDAIANLTKAGNIDLNQSTYKTRLRLIDEQSAKMKKLAEDRVVQETKIAELEKRYGTGQQVTIEEAKLRKIVERQLAEKNIYNTMVDQSKQLSEQDRLSKKLLSLDELREQAQKKRTEASQIVIRNKSDEEEVRKLNREADALEKQANRFSEKSLKKNESELQKQLNAQQSIQKRVDSLLNEAKRKQLSREEEEVQAVKDKFAVLIKEVEDFNKNPKNIAKVGRIGDLKAEMNGQINSIEYRAETDRLKVQLDEEKKLYEEYEDYKNKLGLQAANERYKKEFDTAVSYIEDLKIREGELLNKGENKLTDPEKERLKEIQARIKAETDVERKKYDDLMKSLISYQQERANITAKYQEDLKRIQDDPAASQRLTDNYNIQLKQLDDANLKKLESYKELFSGIEQMSKVNALKLIADTKKQFEKNVKLGLIDPQEVEKIRDYFNKLEKTIKQGTGQELINLANTMDQVISAIGGMDTAFGKVLSTVSNVVGQVGNIKKGMSDFKDAQGKGKNGMADFSSIGQLTAGLGIVGAGISVFSTLFSLFDRSQQREEQAAYAREIQNKQTEALNKSLERQIALVNDAYGTDRLLKYQEAFEAASEVESKYQDQLAKKYTLTGDNGIDKLITKINNGEAKLGGDPISLAIKNLIEKGAIKQLGELKDLTTDQLRSLSDSTILDDSTKNILENLIKAKQAAIDLDNALNAENVGSSLGQIADDFIKTLSDGTQDFGKSFEDTIRTSILNGFKGELIRTQLQGFYDQFAELSKGGLTQQEIEILRDSYSKAAEKAKKDIEDLEKATGIKLNGEKDTAALKPNTLTDSLNQPTGERLEGLWRGNFDLTKQLVVLTQNNGLTMGDMLQIGRSKLAALERIANSNDAIEGHTARLEAIEGALVSIEKNTKPVKSARD